MAKIFKFDAIGRDLYPEERRAAQEFTRKYQSPPTKADTHREMATVAGRVLRAAAHLSATATLNASATVGRGNKVQTSTKSLAASALAGLKPGQTTTKSLAASALAGMKPVKRSTKG